MPFIDGGELSTLRAAAELLPEVTRRAERLDEELSELRLAYDGLRTESTISEGVQERIAAYHTTVNVEDLVDGVTAELAAEGEAQIRQDLAAGLREKRRASTLAEVQITKGPAIRQELDELYQTDGTYDRIDQQAETELRLRVSAELMAKARAASDEELSDPERKAAFMATIENEILASPELAEHRVQFLALMQAAWREESQQLARAKAEAEVLANKDEITATAAESYAASWEGRHDLQRVQAAARETIEALSVEDLLSKTGDETHAELLAARRELEARKLAAKNQAEKLALDFAGAGIDTTEIEANTQVVVRLGSVNKEKVPQKGNYGYNEEVDKLVLTVTRELHLTAMGDGHFRVDSDSLAASTNPYAAKNAIDEGTLIAVGMLVSEAGTGAGATGKPERKLLPRLKAGATLQYDNDTTTPTTFTDTMQPIGDVVISDVSARKYEHIRHELY